MLSEEETRYLLKHAKHLTRDGYLIGLDYGTGKIGVAVGQLLTASASAQSPILNHFLDLDWEKFDALIKRWRPQALVVGIPLNLNGERSRVTRWARRFLASLRARFTLPVFVADEQLTTREAKALASSDKAFYGNSHHSIDSLAAKLILEGWMLDVLTKSLI